MLKCAGLNKFFIKQKYICKFLYYNSLKERWLWKSQSNNQTGIYIISMAISGVNCSGFFSDTLEVFENPSLASTPTPPSCFNGNDGSISVSATGGTPGYTFSIDSVNYQNTNKLSYKF